MDDLRAQLRFHPEDGSIRLGDVRMALIHLPALTALRRELVDSLGIESARGLLTRMGYAAGWVDGELVRKVRSRSSLFDAFLTGPQLQALEGMYQLEPLRFDYDPARGHFDGEGLWKNSAEVDCHVAAYGVSSEPVCWMQVGYASGYTTAFVGKPCLVREIECRATGAPHCRVVGKTVDEWGGEAIADARFLQPQDLRRPMAEGDPSDRRAKTSDEDRGERRRLSSSDLVGASPSFHAACHKVRRVATTRATVLFLGETG
ncbi:MAG: XylR N-terminal domain-containing protein, partial [Candidatus Binatia bacterium]